MSDKNVTKKQQQQTLKNTAAVTQASALDIKTTLGDLTSASLSIQATLSGIQEQLIAKHAELRAVDDAISVKKGELQQVHGVDAVLYTVDDAKAIHASLVEKLMAERARIEKENQDLLAERENERARTEAEHQYNLLQNRKIEADKWAEQLRVRNNAERDRVEAFDKDLANRMANLVAKEKEYNEAIAKAASFETELAKAVAKEVAIATNSQKKDYEHKAQIIDIEHKAEVLGLKSQISQHEKALDERNGRILALEVQLKAAMEAQVALATKTVEGASNKQALADLQSIVTNTGGTNGRTARQS